VIISATYNYARYLPAAIDSVLGQTFSGRYQLVVVDDGSTDETPAVLARYAHEPRVRCIRQPNAGQSAALNTAIRATESDGIMFLDADDLLLDGCLARTMEFFHSREGLGLVFADYEIFNERGTLEPSGTATWKNFRRIPHRVVGSDQWLFEGSLTPHILRYGSFMPTTSLTVRRRFLPDSGLFFEGCAYGGETDFSARCALDCESGYIDQVLSRKRDHPASVIHNDAQRVVYAACMLAIAEAQREAFAGRRELLGILRRQIPQYAADYAWGLLEEGRRAEARRVLGCYTRRYPLTGKFYRLWGKYWSRRRSPRI